jgi:hypothetical protein
MRYVPTPSLLYFQKLRIMILIFIFSFFFFCSFNWQVCNGATYVHVDVLENMKDGAKMLQVDGR